ncbi:Uncharacterised protein [Bordetella pertussis]|nr:Uncharacterised protein [Bordetella pertussis]
MTISSTLRPVAASVSTAARPSPSIESPAIFPVSTSFVRAAAAFPVVP